MRNPTVVVITDRNDLDDQLFGTFARCAELLRQPPVQAESRAHLRELLRVDAGGVVFTTIQKFWPEGSGRGTWACRPARRARRATRDYGRRREIAGRRAGEMTSCCRGGAILW